MQPAPPAKKHPQDTPLEMHPQDAARALLQFLALLIKSLEDDQNIHARNKSDTQKRERELQDMFDRGGFCNRQLVKLGMLVKGGQELYKSFERRRETTVETVGMCRLSGPCFRLLGKLHRERCNLILGSASVALTQLAHTVRVQIIVYSGSV